MPAMTTTIPGLTTEPTDTTTVDFDNGELPRDDTGRIPAFIGLAKATGGLYAENLTGLTIAQALAAVRLDFTVTKVPFTGAITRQIEGVPYLVDVPGPSKLAMTVATWPHPGPDSDPYGLGVVGKDYGIVQPAAAGEFAQQVLDESGATVVAVCAYGNPQGSRMLLALQLPTGLLIGGVDPHDVYLVVGNSFNAETGLWACAAPIRIDCTNQIAGTFGRRAARFTIPHRTSVDDRIDEVRETLRITGTFAQRYAEAAERLLTAEMTGGEITDFCKTLLPTPKDVKTALGAERWDLRRFQLGELIRAGEKNTVGRGTRYAALQGVTELADHLTKADTLTSRYARLVTGSGAPEKLKQRATSLLLTGI